MIVSTFFSRSTGKGNPIKNVLGKSKMILGFCEGIPTMLMGEVAMVFSPQLCRLTYFTIFKHLMVFYFEKSCRNAWYYAHISLLSFYFSNTFLTIF